jgi:membrane protein
MRLKLEISKLGSLARETLVEWLDDDLVTHAASLAYYTVFSIAPTLVIAVALAGTLFGAEAARGQIQGQIQGMVGESGARAIGEMMVSAAQPGRGLLATLVGTGVLVFGATGVFASLQNALNRIWGAKPSTTNSVVSFFRTRFLSFAMVLGTGFLLLVSLVISAGLAAASQWLGGRFPGLESVWQPVNFLVSFGVVTALFAMTYKVLPDAKVAWRDVWLGAAVTAGLFNIGQLGIGLYLGKSSIASGYGAAGSLAVLLVWIYYSSMVLFLGAEFTQVCARARVPATEGSKKDLVIHRDQLAQSMSSAARGV